MAQWQWHRPAPFTLALTVREEDTDRLGHANNVVYVQWMESISWQHIESLGMTWKLQSRHGKAMAIVRTEIDYLAPAFAGDELLLGTWLTEFDGRLRSARAFELVRPSDGRTLLKAQCRHVCIDLSNQKPGRVPPPIAERLRAGLAPPVPDRGSDQQADTQQ
ncbi:MAG: thioesterase family protein [Oleiphilaceae bacterium]|nr:thioesterase family protein [Oleiphilaceae bacterium]